MVQGALVLLLAMHPPADAQPSVIDGIVFGVEASEAAHDFTEAASAIEVGGLGEGCRRIGADGFLRWTSACDPDGPNYLAVVLWGSDIGPGQLYIYDGDERIGAYQSVQPELDKTGGHRGHDPAHPGRFLHSTYLLPTSLTEGRTEVSLMIGSTGQPTPYSATRKESEQDRASRGIYRAYMSREPFLEPPADMPKSEAPAPAPPLRDADGRSTLEFLHAKLDAAVDRFLAWQYYGPEWDASVAIGKSPGELTGAFSIGGVKDAGWSKQEWKDQLAGRMGGNRVGLLLPEIWARAYQAEWSRHHGDAEIVERVVLALDYVRLAQGNNGGFDDIWEHQWIGGPQRRRAGNCLEGFGQIGPPSAYLTLQAEIAASGYLDEPIDEDDNPGTPPVARREAWARLFLDGRNYLVSGIGRGHAPNQDMSDIVAAITHDRCLREIAPDHAWADQTVSEYVDVAMGLAKDIYGGYWISRKGISCEPHGTSNGGYCGNYGDLSAPMFRLAELTQDPMISARALECSHALMRLRYMSLDAENRLVVRREGVVTWRNNHTPGIIAYGGNPYAAVVLGDKANLRAIQLADKQGGYFRTEPFLPGPYNVHLPAMTVGFMREIDLIEQALALPPTDARLPFEPGQPDFAWADEQAGLVVVIRGEERLAVSLNWRHGFGEGSGTKGRRPDNAVAGEIARVHHTTPEVERVANVRMQTIGGFGGLCFCRFGPYLIVMNAGWSRDPADAGPALSFAPPEGLPDAATDLITRKRVDLTRDVRVEDETTLVFDVGAGG